MDFPLKICQHIIKIDKMSINKNYRQNFLKTGFVLKKKLTIVLINQKNVDYIKKLKIFSIIKMY